MIRIPARLRDSTGFALAMAIFAIVLLAAVVASGYFSASQEFQIGQGMRTLTKSFYSGESGIHKVLAEWDPVIHGGLQPGETASVGPFSFEGGGSYQASIIRVGSFADSIKRYFYIQAEGRPPNPRRGARRQALLARSTFPDMCCGAAAHILGDISFGGGGQKIVSGINNDPPGSWPASACVGYPGDSLPGVIVSPTSVVDQPNRIEGFPVPIATDSAMTPANLFDFGLYTWNELLAMADHTFIGDTTFSGSQPTVDANGLCERSNPLNWGDSNPAHPCFNYFPVIAVTGDLVLGGSGYAQGIFLVGDDFQLNGPYQFYGLALVGDSLKLGGPVDFYGSARAGGPLTFSGTQPRFRLSQCAGGRAERLSTLTWPRPLPSRAWVELF